MFTIVYPPISDIKDEIARRRIVTVKFEDVEASRELTQTFSFRINEDVATMKNTANQYLDELNFVPPTLTDFTPDAEVVVVPTAAELASTEWDSDRSKLKTLMELVRDGVFTGSETQITALQTKVKTGFKVGYLG